MGSIWSEIKREQMEIRGYTCEVTGCDGVVSDAHHVFYGRKKTDDQFDVEENMQLVCRDCHTNGTANSQYNKWEFWGVQAWRYGEGRMKIWNENLDIKIRLKFR